MTDREPRPSDLELSGAGWSDLGDESTAPPGAEPPTDDGPHPFRIEASARYRELELAGKGGMGRVMVARDRRLGRDVALKRIAAGDDVPGLAARLAREARITAVLEHPSIIPVYDAGVGGDGRLYYTMRLVQGRSLAEAEAACQRPHDRLRLLRPFLAVCEAVGYAHSRGVVHRDLKPANVMVGSFGETQVVDWGLAAFTVAAPAALRDEPQAVGHTDAAVGTPGYMSPEQAAGAPADPRADVWSLGVILRELVTGARRDPGDAPTPPLRRATYGALPAAERATALPPELAAIVAKATAANPARRYSDAGAMAAEVARFLDGRRVEAHTYSTLELARRLVRRLRVPLALVATALVVTAVAGLLSYRRVAREQRETAHALARAHTRQAIAELERGAVPEAGVLAAHALEQGDDPDARGVVAAALASPHPRYAATIALPGCPKVIPGSWDLALCMHAETIELWQLQPVRRRWHAALPVRRLGLMRPAHGPARVVAVDGSALVLLDADTGDVVHRPPLEVAVGFADVLAISHDGARVAVTDGLVVNVVDLDGRVTSSRPCLSQQVVTVGPTPTGFVAVCSADDTRLFDDASRGWRPGPRLAVPGLRPFSASVSGDGRWLAVGGLTGQVVHVELATGAASTLQLGRTGVVRVAYLPGPGPRLLVGTEQAGAAVIDLASGAELLRLPQAISEQFVVGPEGVVSGGRQAGRWQLDEQLQPRALRAPAGLSSVATTADRRWIAASRGDGRVSIWDGRTGVLAADLPIANLVIKAVAFSPAGDRLAITQGGASYATTTRAVGTWLPVELDTRGESMRRLVYDGDGTLVGATFSGPPVTLAASGQRHVLAGPEMVDLATTPDRARVVLLGRDGWVYVMASGGLVPIAHAPAADAVAAWAGGAIVATSNSGTVRIHGGLGGVRQLELGARILDLAVTPDERHLLAATSSGAIVVWRLSDGRQVATLRGHTQRAAHLAFSADGVVLSAGWDGAVLMWDLRALDATPAALVAQLEARWATSLALAMPAVGP